MSTGTENTFRPNRTMGSMMQKVSANDFDKVVLQSAETVLVNVWASWNTESRKMAAVMENLARLLDTKVRIVKVDWEKDSTFANQLHVYGVPSLLIYKDGSQVAQFSGVVSKDELMSILNPLNN